MSSRPRPQAMILLAGTTAPHTDLAAMTLGWMCAEAGVLFDVYYAADHEHGGLFSKHGSPVISGQHGARLARAMATFDVTVVRFDEVHLFDTLIRRAARVMPAGDDLPALYQQAADLLNVQTPGSPLLIDPTAAISLTIFFPLIAERRGWAFPDGEGKTGERISFPGVDSALAMAQRYAAGCNGIDLYEPLLASHMLPFNQRNNRLILPYASKAEAAVRRDQMLGLLANRPVSVSYGRWFGDGELQPLAKVPMAFSVVEPHRHGLSLFESTPTPLPEPQRSWLDLEPNDDQLKCWAAEKKILASWLLHSGELSHDDSVTAFMDWSTMTKVKIGSGVHWQRYHFDPDVVEPLQVPVEQGGVLGLVEPVLHSAGAGIIWETAGDPRAIAALMKQSRDRIAEVAGDRFAPRGLYCFADHLHQPAGDVAGEAQKALWAAIRDAGFEYVVTSALHGPSRVLYRDADFVVLNQAGDWHAYSPFVRGSPKSFARHEAELVQRDQPGWLLGAIDTPIHGCQIYIGRPYGKPDFQIRINEFYDYVQNGGISGRVISATPRTIARYARLLEGSGR